MAIKGGKNKFLRAVAEKNRKEKPQSSGGTGGFVRRPAKAENVGVRWEDYPAKSSYPFPHVKVIENYDAEQNMDLVIRVELSHGEFVDIKPRDSEIQQLVLSGTRYLFRRLA